MKKLSRIKAITTATILLSMPAFPALSQTQVQKAMKIQEKEYLFTITVPGPAKDSIYLSLQLKQDNKPVTIKQLGEQLRHNFARLDNFCIEEDDIRHLTIDEKDYIRFSYSFSKDTVAHGQHLVYKELVTNLYKLENNELFDVHYWGKEIEGQYYGRTMDDAVGTPNTPEEELLFNKQGILPFTPNECIQEAIVSWYRANPSAKYRPLRSVSIYGKGIEELFNSCPNILETKSFSVAVVNNVYNNNMVIRRETWKWPFDKTERHAYDILFCNCPEIDQRGMTLKTVSLLKDNTIIIKLKRKILGYKKIKVDISESYQQ